MPAAVRRGQRLAIDEVPDPVPGPGQVLVETIACGICGSHLHALKQAERVVEAAAASGVPSLFDPERDMVMGHEFSGRVLGLGPGARGVAPGDVVVAMPLMMSPQGPAVVGFSNDYPGGYGELPASASFCLNRGRRQTDSLTSGAG